MRAKHEGHQGPRKREPQSRLAYWRRDRGLTQRELAAAVGVSHTTYWRLESGEMGNPPLRLLVNCALALGVELAWVCEPEWLEWTMFSKNAAHPPDPNALRRYTK